MFVVYCVLILVVYVLWFCVGRWGWFAGFDLVLSIDLLGI